MSCLEARRAALQQALDIARRTIFIEDAEAALASLLRVAEVQIEQRSPAPLVATFGCDSDLDRGVVVLTLEDQNFRLDLETTAELADSLVFCAEALVRRELAELDSDES